MVVLFVFDRELFERFLDHLPVLALREFQIGLAARTAAPVRMIKRNVAFSAVVACTALFPPVPRVVFEKAWMVPCV